MGRNAMPGFLHGVNAMSLSAEHGKPIPVPGRSFVNGCYLDSAGVFTKEHINPSTGEPQAEVVVAGEREVNAAVDAARAAQKKWLAMPSYLRIQCFKRLSALLEENADQLRFLSARESGIPLMIDPLPIALAWVDHYMGWVDKIEGTFQGESYPMPGFNYTRMEPYGVVGVIIPWNGPLIATTMMAIPPIVAGNAVVMKPPSQSPFVPLRIAELFREAGFPDGLLNIVPGDAEAGEALVRHPGVGKVSFTGGDGVARKVMAMASEHLKPVALELGGKSASLVFDDADLESAATQAVFGSLGLSGQGCVNPTRLLVARKCYDEMVERVAATARAVTVGDPFDAATFNGPVINAAACERILGVIDRSRSQGRLVAGGNRLGGELANGYFIEATVFADIEPGSPLEQNEVFGPVLAVVPFDSDAEALEIANGTRFGLGAYLHTRDLDRAHTFAERLQAGYVNINGFATMAPTAPFGGYKQSGIGRTGGRPGVEEFLQTKNVFIARPEREL